MSRTWWLGGAGRGGPSAANQREGLLIERDAEPELHAEDDRLGHEPPDHHDRARQPEQQHHGRDEHAGDGNLLRWEALGDANGRDRLHRLHAHRRVPAQARQHVEHAGKKDGGDEVDGPLARQPEEQGDERAQIAQRARHLAQRQPAAVSEPAERHR